MQCASLHLLSEQISGLLLGAALFGLSTAGSRLDSCGGNKTLDANVSTPAYWPFDEDELDRAVCL